MSRDTPILVIDDGELDSACAILEQLGADFERLPGSGARAPVRQPGTLLLSSEARARSLRMQRAVGGADPRATWIAFVTEGSEAQTPALSAAGFDFLVREPVHPAALRVLLQRALFRGPDARHAPRVAFGQPVTFKTGAWRESAILIDLSPRGCRLLAPRPPKERSEIAVQLPATLAGGPSLELLGHVVRVTSAELECGRIGETNVGVRFAPLDPSTRERLDAVLAERVLGPALLSADAVPVESEPRPARRKKRASYAKKLTAMEGGNAYMVMCRDISQQGMRIEPVEGLEVGSRLELAIALSARDEPFLVAASVIRDDGDRGLALHFDWIEPDAQERLQALLAKLPAIEALQDDARGQGTVPAQRLSSEPGEAI